MKTFTKNMAVETPTNSLKHSLLRYAKDKGVPVYTGAFNSDYEEYPNICFDGNELCGTSSSRKYLGEEKTFITIDEFIKYCDNWEKQTLQLTSDYKAVVDYSKSIVNVGCQAIPFSKINELFYLINK